MTIGLKTPLVLASAAVLLCGTAAAQLASPNPTGPFADSIERRRAEQDLRSLPQKLRRRLDQNLSDRRIVEQMNEDFLRIQAIRAELVKAFGSGAEIEPRKLESSASEIRKRAMRLRESLALTEENSNLKVSREPEPSIKTVNARAFELCLEISRFTGNPLFKSKGVITIAHAKEAGLSLDTIVALARVVQNEADGLIDN